VQAKHQMIYNHFQNHTGFFPRNYAFNYEELGWQPQQLHHLGLPFSEAEVEETIKSMPKEKASGPNGFIGTFFRSCWQIVKDDLMAVVNKFYTRNQQGLHYLNQAWVVLILKKPNADKVKDFRSISLIRSFAKLITKMLANRLAPELGKLVSINQSAFIKKCCIHNNFLYVQQIIKDLHKKKIPSLFIKLDISKTFDTVNWSYLLDVMSFLCFGNNWKDWLSALWGHLFLILFA
jgi:hypothetical protein